MVSYSVKGILKSITNVYGFSAAEVLPPYYVVNHVVNHNHVCLNNFLYIHHFTKAIELEHLKI